MFRHRLWFTCILVLSLALGLTVQAQDSQPTPVNPNANITWPPPVYVLRGDFSIRGSANLPNMTNYFLQFRPLNDDLTPQADNIPWLPVTIPVSSAVQDDVLGVWDTTTASDGLYELRLTINVRGGDPVQVDVAPLRVENEPPPFAVTPVVQATPIVQPTTPIIQPTLLPTPTAFDPTPRVVSTTNANVRRGDSTIYDAIAALRPDQEAPIVGISALNTGWFLIQLPDGRQGWVSPSVVQVRGDLSGVPRVQPPPPPTPTPIPATPTPIATVNLVAGNFRFDPPSPQCGQTFNLYIDVANFGSTVNPSGFILVQDFRNADRSLQQQTYGPIPSIQPGQTINIGPIPLTVSTWYNEEHRLIFTLDPSNQIPETNKADNVKEAIYVLPKGSCP